MMDCQEPNLPYCSKQLRNQTKSRKLFSDTGQQDYLSRLSSGFDFCVQGSSLNLLKNFPTDLQCHLCHIPPSHIRIHWLLVSLFLSLCWYNRVLLLQFYEKLWCLVYQDPPIYYSLKVSFGPLLFHINFMISLVSSILFNKFYNFLQSTWTPSVIFILIFLVSIIQGIF